MNTSPIRLGIVGCGTVTDHHHLAALRRVPGAQVVAVVDVNPARLELIANRFRIEHRYSDYRALLARNDIDAVAVITPTQFHAEIALAALDAGKHLFVEKPVALTLEDCQLLIKRAARSLCQVTIGFNLRWHRLVRQMRDLVLSGMLGKIHALRSTYTHWRENEGVPEWHRVHAQGGGIILNETVHIFDLWRFVLGREVTQVCADTQGSPFYEDETSVITARLTDDVLASGTFSLKTSPHCEVEIFGEAGRLYLSLHRFDGLEFYSNQTFAGNMSNRWQNTWRAIRASHRIIENLRRGGDMEDTYRAEWQHFIDCIRQAKPPECSLVDGMRAVQVALGVIESDLNRQPIKLVQ